MKAVKAELAKTEPDRVEKFEKGAAAYAKNIVKNFKDYEFVRFLPNMSFLMPKGPSSTPANR